MNETNDRLLNGHRQRLTSSHRLAPLPLQDTTSPMELAGKPKSVTPTTHLLPPERCLEMMFESVCGWARLVPDQPHAWEPVGCEKSSCPLQID